MNTLFDDTELLRQMHMVICPVNRMIFKTTSYRLKIGKGKYCSRKCYKIAKKGTRTVPRKTIICKNCGKSKEVREKEKTIYCSKSCRTTAENKKRKSN